jgi:hypothetical protein
MLLTVTALSEEDFQAWVNEQTAPSAQESANGDGPEQDGETGE